MRRPRRPSSIWRRAALAGSPRTKGLATKGGKSKILSAIYLRSKPWRAGGFGRYLHGAGEPSSGSPNRCLDYQKIRSAGLYCRELFAIHSYSVRHCTHRQGTLHMAKDPTKMSLKELQELEVKVKKAKLSMQERSRSELRQKLESMAAQAGFKLSDLFGGRGGKGRKVAAKYANPDNPSETWSGRGRKPRWLAARLKAGDRIDKFLIK
jgi:DNA-binding protein H-NS